LAPFNKPSQRFLFLTFNNNQANARKWLGELVTEGVVSTTEQVVGHGADRRAAPEGQDAPTRTWVGVGLTSPALVTLRPEFAADLPAYDAFWRGAPADRQYSGSRMASPALVGNVQISDPQHWVIGGPSQPPVDALLTIAADDKDLVDDAARRERDRAVGHGLDVLLIDEDDGDDPTLGQYGERLKDGIEHFGFRDGISQPGIRNLTEARLLPGRRREAVTRAGTPILAAGEFVLGYERERGSYPSAARPDPPEWMCDGSFQVFLRLSQDVPGWRNQMDRLRASSHADVYVEAKAIGRTKKGFPLATGGQNGELNDFNYDDDPQGLTTPLFSHIRSMNRREKASLDERTRYLARRGIPFGPFLPEGAPDDGKQRGLLFNAFMASIEGQFEYLMRTASGSVASPVTTSTTLGGPDPVVGASDAPCHLLQEGREPVEIHFGRFVRTRGAVYAFAPSLPTLSRLAGIQAAQIE
jgi:deferrochelatase/peroxidase EfeB